MYETILMAVWELPLAIILWIVVAFLVALGVLGLLLVIAFLCGIAYDL